MTTASHELALWVINTGEGYGDRCAAARQVTHPSYKAYRFKRFASDGASAYEREFGTPGEHVFTAEDILLAAAELAEYYARHVAEADAADKAAPMLNLAFDDTDSGNCRVYFKGAGHYAKRLYCWQMDGIPNEKPFVLYRCSRDGEPEAPVRLDLIGETELPAASDDDERILRDLRDFLATKAEG